MNDPATHDSTTRSDDPRRVLDAINTDRSAKELLDHRVAQVNATGRYRNAICCGPGEYVDWLRQRGHEVRVVPTPRTLSPWGILSAIWGTYRLLRAERIDLLHSHASVSGLASRAAAFLARTPYVIHQAHGFHHHDRMSALPRWVFIKAEWCLGLVTDKLLFQNQADIDECLRRRIAPVRKLILIGNGVQLDAFPATDPPNNNPPVVLCVGRLESVKRPELVLQAAGKLKERGVAFVLRFVGDGDLRSSLQAWVDAHGLEAHVRFLGYRDDVAKQTADADVCVLASIKEGLPRAILEAAAVGRPMVASDVVGNRDCVLDGETGFLFPPNDATGLADRLQKLLCDSALRAKIGQNAAAYARANFDEHTITERIIAVYDQAGENR